MLLKILEFFYLKKKGNLVYYDSMTGCKTRLYFDKVAKRKYSLSNYGVIYVDIDNLKRINDEKGHDFGDEEIKRVANELLNLKDVLDVCRVGGDEFVVFTNVPFDFKEIDKISNISYGFDFKDVCQTIESTITNAEKAMYTIKKRKKNTRRSV